MRLVHMRIEANETGSTRAGNLIQVNRLRLHIEDSLRSSDRLLIGALACGSLHEL